MIYDNRPNSLHNRVRLHGGNFLLSRLPWWMYPERTGVADVGIPYDLLARRPAVVCLEVCSSSGEVASLAIIQLTNWQQWV